MKEQNERFSKELKDAKDVIQGQRKSFSSKLKKMEDAQELMERQNADRIRQMERNWTTKKEEFVKAQQALSEQLKLAKDAQAAKEEELREARKKHDQLLR